MSSFFERGNRAFRAGDYALAAKLFQAAISQTPKLARSIRFNLDLVKKRLSEQESEQISFTNDSKRFSIYEGRVEKEAQCELVGWAVSRTEPSAVFTIDVLIDGVFFTQIRNDISRGDLKRHGKSTGLGGFRLRIPADLIVGDRHKVELRFPDGKIFARNAMRAPEEPRLSPIYSDYQHAPVAVIVPVFNAADEFAQCLDCLLRYTPKLPYQDVEFILIDDASTDPEIARIFAAAAKHERVRVHRNAENLGFTRTVNRGIDMAGNRDVVLLNSDARVTPRWLMGLQAAIAEDPRIATATPMSDRAGAFSAPTIGNDNPLPLGVSEAEYALAFRRRAKGLYPEVPTGNGFCLYIRRQAIDELGGLDAEAFPRGYGEENDFCMRARAHGWRNIIDDRTYVFHSRSKSFGDEKTALMKAGRAIINQRYPDYGHAIRVFSEGQQIAAARFAGAQALDECLEPVKERILYVTSTRTGGTPQTNMDLMRAATDTIEPWWLRCDTRVLYLYRVTSRGETLVARHTLSEEVEPLRHRSLEYERVVAGWLRRYDFAGVHIRHIAWHSLALPKLARLFGCKVWFSFHDFYTVCPTVKLIDGVGRYCGGDCSQGQGECKPELWNGVLPELRGYWLPQWQQKFAQFLSECDGYFTTSQSAKALIQRVYSVTNEKPFAVIEHGREFSSMRCPQPITRSPSVIKLLVPGNLDAAKGLDVVRRLLLLDTEQRLEFHFLGTVAEPIIDPRVVVHGAYHRAEFVERVEAIAPDISVIFSVWDETWCHTLTESWAAGVPVIGFDFPTVAQRIEQSQAGWVFSGDSATETAALYVFIQECLQPSTYNDAIAALVRWQQQDALIDCPRVMAARYLQVYKSQLLGAEVPLVAVLAPANRQCTKGPGSTYVRLWGKTQNQLSRPVQYVRVTSAELLAGIQRGLLPSAIIQRTAVEAEHWPLLSTAAEQGQFHYVYEIDDDLLNVPEGKDKKGVYLKMRPQLQALVEQANVVLTSTPWLQKTLAGYHNRIAIEANYLNTGYWRSAATTSGNISIQPWALYFGSFTHAEDLDLILPALKRIAEQYPDFRLKLVGVAADHFVEYPWIDKLDIEPEQKEYPEFVRLLMRQAERCRFAIAPLSDEPFNRNKSYLKVIESLALGLPVLASKVEAYQHGAFPNDAVQLLENDSDSWFAALSAIIKQPIDQNTSRAEKVKLQNLAYERYGFATDTFDQQLMRLLQLDV